MGAIVSSPVREILVADIHASPLNPRKHFDAAKLSELAESLINSGQIEATTVRPSASQPGKFEIVNGERRWRAAQLAKLKTLAARVREMTDAEALAIMLITGAEGNVEALTPLEEAGGYQDAMRIMGLTLDALAARFGRGVAYIHRRLTLLQLPEESRAALDRGELAPRTAFEIARIPSAAKREEAEKAILHSELHGGVMPQRAAKLYIEKQICRTLQGAPFDSADKELVKDAGPCTSCQWRAGNNRETYGDVKNPHTCMNPGCFETKVAAARARVLAKEARNGKEALPTATNAEVFPAGEKGVSWKSEYVAFTQPVPRDLLKPEVTKAPKWEELCADRGVKVYVGIDQAGRAVDLVKLSEAMVAVDPNETAIFTEDVRRRHLMSRPAESTERVPAKKKAKRLPPKPSAETPEKRPNDPRSAMLGHALFSPGEHPHFVEVRLAETREAFRAVCGEADWQDDMLAFCLFDYDATGENLGQLVFERGKVTRSLLVHECVHAALAFVSAKVMRSGAVLAMSDDEQDTYFNEAVPQVVEKLFTQAEELLFGEEAQPVAAPAAAAPVTEDRTRLVEWTKAKELGMSAQKIAATYRVPLEDVCGALGIDLIATRNEFSQLRQDAEAAYEALGIKSEEVRDRTAKFASGGLRFAEITTPEHMRAVLRVLSAKVPATISTAKTDSEEGHEG